MSCQLGVHNNLASWHDIVTFLHGKDSLPAIPLLSRLRFLDPKGHVVCYVGIKLSCLSLHVHDLTFVG